MKSKSKILVGTAIGTACAALIIFAGYRMLTDRRQARWLRNARQYIEHNEPRKALLCLENALKHNPNDIAACRLMASTAEASRLPIAMAWRNRVLELNPHSLDDRIALAQTAMLFGDPRLAASVLENADPATRQNARYFNAAGVVANALNQPAKAAANFLEASRLDPGNEVTRFNLAVVQLQTTNAGASAASRELIAAMATNAASPEIKSMALRELARDALRHEQMNVALERTEQLLHETNFVYADRLLRLQVLRQAQDARFPSALSDAEHEASSDIRNLYECATWEMETLSSTEALRWLQSLPLNLQTNQPAALLIAECLAIKGDWHTLSLSLSGAHWGEWEFVRRAFSARALQCEDMKIAADTEWSGALNAAASRQTQLHILLNLATQWNWQHAQQAVLWNLIRFHPEEHWAVDALSQSLFQEGQTRSLMKLWSEECKRSPASLTAANNLALTALLLDAQEFKPHDLARDVYQRASTNAYYGSTYAFSLYLQGKYADALSVMNQFDARTLANPSIAGYYGLFLKAAGQKENAQLYFEKASRAPLLPEERRIINQASAHHS